MDIILELIDAVWDFYFDLMLLIVPEKKLSKKHRVVIKVVAVVVTFGLLALFILGCGLVMENRIILGVILIVISSVISLAQIIAGIVLYKKHH